MARRPRPDRGAAAGPGSQATGLDDPGAVDTVATRPGTQDVVLVVAVARPWEAADHGRLKKKIAAYLEHIGGDGLSAQVPDWPAGETTIAVHATEPPPEAFAPLWERYGFTLQSQFGLGFRVEVLQGANEAEPIYAVAGSAGTDADGARRGGRAFGLFVRDRLLGSGAVSDATLDETFTLRFTREGTPYDVSLEGPWRESRGRGAEALTRVVDRHVAAWTGADASADDKAAHVLPLLRPIGCVEEMQALQAQHGALAAPEIHEPFSSDIILSYVIDGGQTMTSLAPEEVDDLAGSWDALHDLAVGNLWRRAEPLLQVHVFEEGIWMVAVHGHAASGLLCVAPLWQRLGADVPGPVVAAVPARDLLLFTGRDDTRAVEALRLRAGELHGTADHPIAPGLLWLAPKGWMDLPPLA